MSEKISTPSPVSSCLTSSRAAGSSAMRVVGRGDRQHLELRRPAAEHVRDGAREAFGEAVVRNDQDADHRGSRDGAIASIGAGGGALARIGMAVDNGSTRDARCRRVRPTPARARRRTSPPTSKPGLLRDLDEAGRARHVDFGEAVADDVEADDQQALGPEPRPQRGRDLAVARGERPRDAAAAGREVAARLARLRDARQRVRARARRRSAARACRRRRSPE